MATSNKTSPDLFAGRPTIATAMEGTRLLHANANRLLNDAKLLLREQRYPGAAMMAVMALAEISRMFHPLTLATMESPHRLREGWRQFRTQCLDFPWSALPGHAPGVEPGEDSELNEMLAFIRKLGGGVEIIDPACWMDPKELVSAELARSIVMTAEMVCGRPIETRAMAAWIEIARSVSGNCDVAEILRRFHERLGEGPSTDVLPINADEPAGDQNSTERSAGAPPFGGNERRESVH